MTENKKLRINRDIFEINLISWIINFVNLCKIHQSNFQSTLYI